MLCNEFDQWGSVTHQMAAPVPSISCCVLNHHNLFYQIQNALAFNQDTCCHLALCLRLFPFYCRYLLFCRVTRRFEKNSPNFEKVAQKVSKSKEGQNIYNKAQFESPKHVHQATFETSKYLQQTMFWSCLFRWKCNKFALTKSSLKCCHYFGLLHLSKKIIMSLQK